jgi:precorrin-6Y C5,15-methyltransferase (decarboxylating)
VIPWLTIIGLGEDGIAGLSPASRALLQTAELVVGGKRHLAHAAALIDAAERLAWRSPLADTLPEIAARRGRRVVVLASGDPMCYGVGAMLARRFDPAEMNILPQPGAFSLAAARLAWPLEEVVGFSLHGRPLDTLRLHLAPGARLLILSENGETPAQVAALLRAEGWGDSLLTVLEHMGGKHERRLDDTAAAWSQARCADLNLLAIACRAGAEARPLSRLAGLPDEAFAHDGQLTKREIRAATLAALGPLAGETLWDIGAGCGSIAIEWMRAPRRNRAIAIEREAARCALIARNAAQLGVPDLDIRQGVAPGGIAGLAVPDAIFIGGGLSAAGLFEALWAALRPGGRLVANAVTVGGETRLAAWQAQHSGTLTRLAVSRAEPIGGRLGWRSLRPVTQLRSVKPG